MMRSPEVVVAMVDVLPYGGGKDESRGSVGER
jgi:hypothetical protein